ncbi:MAG: S41 family peptidase [Isosphaeraceae bacterium]
MRVFESSRTAWLLSVLLAWTLPSATADPFDAGTQATVSAPSSGIGEASDSDELTSTLKRALDFERQRNWTAAIDVYDKALERWPGRTEFTHRRRLCETHYRLVRRYQDRSFRDVLLKLPRERSLALYDEMLERIETHYVDEVPLAPLLRRGIDNLEVALRDPNFLRVNAGSATPERIAWVRDNLRRVRASLNVPNREVARAQVLSVCEIARQGVGLSEAPVILEFTYGACDALDDYTSYLTPDKLDDLYAMIDGNFVGLGIELKLDGDALRLVGVIRGGPASEAGLKPGDQITHIGGTPVKGLSLDEAAGRLQGTEGTQVEITVLRANQVTQTFRMARRHVEVESVDQVKMLDPAQGIGYVQLNGFQKSSAEELERAIESLSRQGMTKLVLDLRGNPGGLLNIAVEIAERFIDNGVIVSTRGRAAGQSQVYRANTRAVWRMPLYVLIDHDSASASEILAGALKDHRRAIVVGERSYGKGSVQSIFSLRSAPAGLKLTTAKFYSPRNRPYSEQGVEPDLSVRTVARPSQDRPAGTPPALGDPATDPALELTLRHVHTHYKAAR